MSLMQRTGKNISWILISDIATKGAVVIVTIYLARVLGVVEFGIFSLGVALASSLWPLVDFGSTGFGTREVAHDKSRAKWMISSLNSMRLLGSIVVITICFITFQIMDMDAIKQWSLMCALLYLIGYAISPDWVVRGIEKMQYLVVINFVTATLFIVGTILIVKTSDDVVTASLLRSIAFTAGSMAGLYLLARYCNIYFRPKIDIAHWIDLIRKTYIFLINRLATNLGQFAPFYIITIFYSDEITGLFAASHRLYIIALTGLFAVTTAVFPILSDLARNKPDKLIAYQHQLIQFMMFLFVPLSAFALVYSDEIMLILFGDKYQSAALSMGILLLALPVVAIKSIYVFSLIGSHLEKRAMQVNIFGLLIQILIASVLVSQWHMTGAAITMFIGELLSLLLAYRFSYKEIGRHRLVDGFAIKVLLISLCLALSALYGNIHIYLSLILGIPLYFILSVVFKIIPDVFLQKLKIKKLS